MNSTVTTVESFRFLGTTISQDLKWDIHIDSIVKKAQQRLHFLRQPSPIIGTTLPTLQELYSSRVSKRAGKITLDPHIQHILSLNCCCLIDVTELWAPERPGTGTVSSLRQSISWTLDNNCGTHTIYTLIYLTHILSLHFNLHIICLYIQLSIVIYLYIQLSICINCIHLLFLICFLIVLFIILVFCSVIAILLHCGSFCHENKFLVCVKLILILILQSPFGDSNNAENNTHITFKLYQQQLCQSID